MAAGIRRIVDMEPDTFDLQKACTVKFGTSHAMLAMAAAGQAVTHFEHLPPDTWRGRGLSKSFISRLIIGVTPFRVLITVLITYLLSPLPLQVNPKP